MQFITIIVSALVSSVLALPEAESQPELTLEVAGACYNISSALTVMNDTLNTFKPFQAFGLGTVLQIQKETKVLADSLQAAVAASHKSSPFNKEDSGAIARATVALVSPVNSTLLNIVAHKPAFASGLFLVGDITSTVLKSLVEQRNYTAELGKDLTIKLAEPFSFSAPNVTATLLGFFDVAIARYSVCTGVVCLPPM